MFHACVQRFDGMDEKFLGGKLNRALVHLKTKKFSRFPVTSNLVAHA